MDLAKQPRFPYFDFSEQPLDCGRQQKLRAHFTESLDAITLCRFSDAGKQVFHHNHVHEQKPETRYYRLADCNQGWHWTKYLDDPQPGYSAAFVGDGMMFGRLHAYVAKLDAHIFGPQPVGTVIQLITVDSTVQPGRMQHHPGLLHTDGRSNRFQAVYDYIDDSPLPTRYIVGYAGKTDPLASVLNSIAGLYASQRLHICERFMNDAEYLAQIAAAEDANRFWTAKPDTIVLRAAGTPHMGQMAKVPTRRAHAHMLVSRPQP